MHGGEDRSIGQQLVFNTNYSSLFFSHLSLSTSLGFQGLSSYRVLGHCLFSLPLFIFFADLFNFMRAVSCLSFFTILSLALNTVLDTPRFTMFIKFMNGLTTCKAHNGMLFYLKLCCRWIIIFHILLIQK